MQHGNLLIYLITAKIYNAKAAETVNRSKAGDSSKVLTETAKNMFLASIFNTVNTQKPSV